MAGRLRKFTDAQLREELTAHTPVSSMAEKWGCTPQAIYERIDRLGDQTLAASVAPEESRRFVTQQLDAQAILLRLVERAQRFQDAADSFLRDPEHPTEYFLGARAGEVEVLFFHLDDKGEPTSRKPAKSDLQSLLDHVESLESIRVCSWSIKHADPRSLFLQASAECRGLISQGLELTERLLAVEALDRWKRTVLDAIGRVSPELRREIEAEVRRSLRHYTVLCGPGGEQSGGEPALSGSAASQSEPL